ncbi:MAG: polyprenyl synthetase family protein, partial [Chromatiales bacterium]
IHIHKTGALIRAAVRMAVLAATGLDRDLGERLDRYAKCLGLAFQIRDDILDVEGETAVLGKTQGADSALNKPTYPSILGLDASKQQARELHDEALGSIAELDERADMLRWIAGYIVGRRH